MAHTTRLAGGLTVRTTPSTVAAFVAQRVALRDAALARGDERYAAQMQRSIDSVQAGA